MKSKISFAVLALISNSKAIKHNTVTLSLSPSLAQDDPTPDAVSAETKNETSPSAKAV